MTSSTSSSDRPTASSPTYLLLPLEVNHEKAVQLAELHISSSNTALAVLWTAIARNDLGMFDAAMARSRSIAESMPIGPARNELRRALLVMADVQKLWHFSESDRFGAFFDDDALPGFYDHLTADYAGFAGYIGAFKIADGHGHVVYPSAETRQFLLRQVPSASPAPAPTLVAAKATRHATAKPATKVAAAKHPARKPAAKVAASKVAASKVAASKVAASKVAAAKARHAQKVASVKKTKPVHKPAAVVASAAAKTPVVIQSATPVEAQVLPELKPVAQPEVVESSGSRPGIFFIILALVGVGILTTMLRTPRSEKPKSMLPLVAEPPQAVTESEELGARKSQQGS